VKRLAAACALLAGSSAVSARAETAPSKAGAETAAVAPPSDGAAEPEAGEAAPAKPAVAESEASARAARADAMRAFQTALEKQKLAAAAPLSIQRLEDELVAIEEKLGAGRRDEAIGDLVYLIESPRFEPFASSSEGRAAVFWLGDALSSAGAYEPARAYLRRLLSGDPSDTWYRRAVRSLVDGGLASDRPTEFLKDLELVPPGAPQEIRGDIEYLRGRAHEHDRKPDQALTAYAKVGEKSRFWGQATYLSGVIEVERRNFARGEQLFCKVADPKQTPKKAAMFGGSDFFRVRDLARLGLGRVAHEQYRFDDARYYYYLVPRDSDDLPQALYETATTRYEAKDYDGARQSMDELNRLKVSHPYEDEAYILDAYIDLANCRFPEADGKLKAFLKRYDPVRDAARRLSRDETAMRALVDAVRKGSDPAGANLGVPSDTARTLGALLRVDTGYGRASRRLAELDHQMSGLLRAMGELDEAKQRLAAPKGVQPASTAPLGQSDTDKLRRIESQIAEVRRLLREAERASGARGNLEPLAKELATLEMRARAVRAALPGAKAGAGEKGVDLPGLIVADRERAAAMYAQAQAIRSEVENTQLGFAKDAFQRLDRRLSRLLRRARLGRIETVLGKKRALELEIEALSQGLLPQTIIDSLDAARYLKDDEEYWPFEGEDWEDEYVGGEGLR
jgi:tetratricopeptide (TPR) repeat protein